MEIRVDEKTVRPKSLFEEEWFGAGLQSWYFSLMSEAFHVQLLQSEHAGG